MLTIMQILGYFELIIYIYVVCNRVFTELHHRTAHKASLLRRIFSRCTCFRRPPGRRENRRLYDSLIFKTGVYGSFSQMKNELGRLACNQGGMKARDYGTNANM